MHELSRADRRRLIARSLARIAAWCVVLAVGYTVAPVQSPTAVGTFLRLIVVVAIIVGVMLVQVRAIIRADYPTLRAVEGVLLAIPLFIVLFGLVYLGLAHANHRNFSEPFDRVGALYFTVTVLATVGFGDITPKTDIARIVVTLQMLIDITLVAAAIRVFMWAARSGLTRRNDAG